MDQIEIKKAERPLPVDHEQIRKLTYQCRDLLAQIPKDPDDDFFGEVVALLQKVSTELPRISEDYQTWFWNESTEKNGKYARRMKQAALQIRAEHNRLIEDLEYTENHNDRLREELTEYRVLLRKIEANPSVKKAWEKFQAVLAMSS